MTKNKFGELIFSEDDLCDLVMRGKDPTQMQMIVDDSIDTQRLIENLNDAGIIETWSRPSNTDMTVPEWDARQQQNWYIPDEYKNLDIAQYILGLCKNEEQLQRAGHELLMFQERGLFDLLKYLKYLVDVMRKHHVTWGVGRGSSVASYVLYLLGVHRIDSLFYELDPAEFLR